MSEQLTAARFTEMRKALVRVVLMVDHLQRQWSAVYIPMQYAPGSQAASTAEVANLTGEWSAQFQAWSALCSAAEHLMALERTLDSKWILPFSPWTLARAVLEASQQAAWLLVPDIEETERVARCFALMRRDNKAAMRIMKDDKNAIQRYKRNRSGPRSSRKIDWSCPN